MPGCRMTQQLKSRTNPAQPTGVDPMVLHLSTSDLGHGAGIAAFRIHQGLQSVGYPSRMMVNEKLSDDPFILTVASKPTDQWARLRRDFRHLVESGLNFSAFQNMYSATGRALRGHRLFREAPLIHLHNIHAHVRNIFSVCLFQHLRDRPVIWTLHDMWPLTGHCFYSFECERWLTGCGRCPHKDVYIRLLLDTTAPLFRLKRRLYRHPRLTVVAPSRWLAGIASRSPLFEGRKVLCIPYGIDTAVFHPTDPLEARRQLNLPMDGLPLVLFIAYNLNDPRKGYRFFADAISTLKKDGIDCRPVIIGRGEYFCPLKSDPLTLDLGLVTEPGRLALVYSASNLMVIPSTQDNLPNTAMESLACGAPVLCFRTGGLPDLVRHMKTGFIVEHRETEALARGLATLLGSPMRLIEMRQECRRTILAHFTQERQAADYAALYRESVS